MSGVKKRTFTWRFDSPVQRIWPLLADTALLNEAAEFPKHAIEEIVQSDGSMLFIATATMGPFTFVWDDKPQNWVNNRWFRHCRYFRNGPLNFMCAQLTIEPDESGCRADFTIEAEARNLLGKVILATTFFFQRLKRPIPGWRRMPGNSPLAGQNRNIRCRR